MSHTVAAKRISIREKVWAAILRERGREVKRMLERRFQ